MLHLAVIALLASFPQAPLPYRNSSLPVEVRVNDLLARMTLAEKLNQIRSDNNDAIWMPAAQTTGWGEIFDLLRPLSPFDAALKANEVQRLALKSRLGIPIIIRDEALHGLVGNGPTSFPQSIAMAATWDPDLVGRAAGAIAAECRARGVRRVLSPVINLSRDARWGRTEETYGEDPYLSSRMSAAYVKAFEDTGVATTPKHFVANYGDGGRDSHAIHLTEQFLRETYLAPFEAAVREGGARSIMTAYNSLNGVACSANHWLLTDLLKNEWGFRGVVGSDYGASEGTLGSHHNVADEEHAAAANINGGLDIEWPNIGLWGKPLEQAVKDGLVSQARLDDAVRRMLRNKFDMGLFDHRFVDANEADRVVQSQEHRDLALAAAREAIVLLRNRGNTLPLRKDLKTIAVIGPGAAGGMPLGGYSGWGQPTVSVVDGIKAKVGEDAKVNWVSGSQYGGPPSVPVIPAECYTDLKGEYFANRDMSGTPDLTREDSRIDFDWSSKAPALSVPRTNFSVRWTGKLTAPEGGEYVLAATSDDGVRVWLDGNVVLENWTIHPPTTDRVRIQVRKGRPMDFRVDYYQAEGQAEMRLAWGPVSLPNEGFQDAVRLARESDVAIVVAGIEEGEGRDRAFLDLPGNQEDLINAVAATGTPTVVVLIAGAPVTMRSWLSQADAVVDAWYPGQEGGTAVADVLFGDVNPSGRLPITFPLSIGQCPTYYGIEPSGRGYDYVDLTGQPQFTFGFGLSYTTFEYSNLRIAPAKAGAAAGAAQGEPITITFDLKNTGSVAGCEVPQLYLRDLVASMARPMKELKDFTRVSLDPGETKTVTFRLPQDRLAFWNARMRKVVEPGQFDVMVGASSSDIRLTGSFAVQ